MSQGLPTGLDGQIDSPNSLELLREKNKRFVIAIAALLVVALAINYVLRYLDRQATDAKWTNVASATGFESSYVDLPASPGPNPNQVQSHLFRLKRGLVTELDADLAEADAAELEKALSEHAGDATTEPLLMWVAAARQIADEDFEGAKKRLMQLKGSYPEHFLCKTTASPPQWRKQVEKDEDEGKKPNPRERPEYEPAVSGSLVDRLIADIDAESAFRASHARFYDEVEPDSKETATIEFACEDNPDFSGKVKVRFYSKQSPKHVEAFLKLVREGEFFTNQRVHNISREGSRAREFGMDLAMSPSELKFGLAITKDNEDRSTWTNTSADVGEPNVVDWEGEGLSHFPGMLCAEPHKDGKSQVERLVLTGRDVAATQDGGRVIFGKVVDGLDFLQSMIDLAEFPQETDEQMGRGIPSDNIRVKSITVE